MPAPSPVLPSASTAPRCQIALSASIPACTTLRDGVPSMLTTRPTPQEECSSSSAYIPLAASHARLAASLAAQLPSKSDIAITPHPAPGRIPFIPHQDRLGTARSDASYSARVTRLCTPASATPANAWSTYISCESGNSRASSNSPGINSNGPSSSLIHRCVPHATHQARSAKEDD